MLNVVTMTRDNARDVLEALEQSAPYIEELAFQADCEDSLHEDVQAAIALLKEALA